VQGGHAITCLCLEKAHKKSQLFPDKDKL